MTSPRRPLGAYGLSIVLGVLFLGFWVGPVLREGSLESWQGGFLQAVGLLVLATLITSRGRLHSRDRYDTMQEELARMEDRLDAIGFQLFEERSERTAAQRFFDERRRDRNYDQAYRQAWRALRKPDSEVGDAPR